MFALLCCLLACVVCLYALQYAVSVRTARATAIETDVGTSPFFRIYSGSVPANVAASLGAAVLLAEGQLPSDWATEGSGVLSKQGTWTLTGQSGAGAGTAGTFFRLYASDGTTPKIQGTVSGTGGGGDLTLDDNSIANAQTVTVSSFDVTGSNA